MGDASLGQLPDLLNQLLEKLDSDGEIVNKTEANVSLPNHVTTTLPPATTARAKNFKHKILSSFYKNRNPDVSGGETTLGDQSLRTDLLSSLRSQIVSTALENDDFLAKANNIQRYFPSRKTSSKSIKSFYSTSDPTAAKKTEDDIQKELAAELSSQLRTQLVNLRHRVQTEYDRKEGYRNE